jgi:hypothetical protein
VCGEVGVVVHSVCDSIDGLRTCLWHFYCSRFSSWSSSYQSTSCCSPLCMDDLRQLVTHPVGDGLSSLRDIETDGTDKVLRLSCPVGPSHSCSSQKNSPP